MGRIGLDLTLTRTNARLSPPCTHSVWHLERRPGLDTSSRVWCSRDAHWARVVPHRSFKHLFGETSLYHDRTLEESCTYLWCFEGAGDVRTIEGFYLSLGELSTRVVLNSDRGLLSRFENEIVIAQSRITPRHSLTNMLSTRVPDLFF